MKVDRTKDTEESPRETRGQQVKRMMNKSKQDPEKTRYSQRKQQTSEKKRRYLYIINLYF